MEVGFVVLADHAEALNGKLYANGAGWNMLRFPEMPTTFGFAIGIGIDVAWDDTNRRHRLEIRVEDPDGELLDDEPFRLEFEAGRPPGAPQGIDQRIVFALGTQQTFTMAGPHAVTVLANDAEIGRSRFYVLHQPVAPGMTFGG